MNPDLQTLPTDTINFKDMEKGYAPFAEALRTLGFDWQTNVALVGGDMTRGPLSITVSVKGSVPTGRALMRSGARVGDGIYVTGTLGDAALALSHQIGRAHV